MIKHGLGEQKQPFKKLEIPRGGGHQKYPLERKFQGGGGGGVVGKTLPLGVWLFSGTTHFAGQVHQNRTICCNKTSQGICSIRN